MLNHVLRTRLDVLPARPAVAMAVFAVGAAAALGCAPECGPAASRPAIHGADPAHDTAPRLPPDELGLPPNPMQVTATNPDPYPVPPPPLSDEYFPCTECHDPDDEVNTTRRTLTEEHQDIVLEHDAAHRWCLDCHNPSDRDVLRLASGETVPFAQSYRLCGQCHGPKYRDWKAGAHGKRTGMWNGEKKYLLCPHCHNPHSPRFKPLAPKAPPARPEQIR